MRFQAARSSSSATTAESWASPPSLAMARIAAARSASLPGGQEARQNHPVQCVAVRRCSGVLQMGGGNIGGPAGYPLTLQKVGCLLFSACNSDARNTCDSSPTCGLASSSCSAEGESQEPTD